jgi:UDP-N-acetylglucosamine--N-acetylmuramyl-(pentapeptide) pyrophosphoryl-undecaprenol N-acetylglucosamine transferase
MRQRLRLMTHAAAVSAPQWGRVLRQAGWRHAELVSGVPRLLFYAVNGVGLGHATRLIGIARQVKELRSDAEILFLTTSEAAHLIHREGFAAMKLPSHTLSETGLLPEEQILSLNHHATWTALLSFDPHCLVVDSFPTGIQDELSPLLHGGWRKVFVFRAQRHEFAANPRLQSALSRYDLILLPHEEGSETLPVPPGVASLWTGPMVAHGPSEMLSREAARTALGLPHDGFAGLITLGGGGEPETIEARRQIEVALHEIEAEQPGACWAEAQGPLLRDEASQRFSWLILRDVHPLMLYLNAFDGVISAAGYNTTQELIAARAPTIFWPFPRQLDDQEARARALQATGCALCIGEGAHESRVPELVQALRALHDNETRQRLRDKMQQLHPLVKNGAALGAAAILELLGVTK